jgi:hypothetical protein
VEISGIVCPKIRIIYICTLVDIYLFLIWPLVTAFFFLFSPCFRWIVIGIAGARSFSMQVRRKNGADQMTPARTLLVCDWIRWLASLAMPGWLSAIARVSQLTPSCSSRLRYLDRPLSSRTYDYEWATVFRSISTGGNSLEELPRSPTYAPVFSVSECYTCIRALSFITHACMHTGSLRKFQKDSIF